MPNDTWKYSFLYKNRLKYINCIFIHLLLYLLLYSYIIIVYIFCLSKCEMFEGLSNQHSSCEHLALAPLASIALWGAILGRPDPEVTALHVHLISTPLFPAQASCYFMSLLKTSTSNHCFFLVLVKWNEAHRIWTRCTDTVYSPPHPPTVNLTPSQSV